MQSGSLADDETKPGLDRHPPRKALLELIIRDSVVTAVGAARELGGSSGYYSFHLRRLAQHRLIEEAPAPQGRGSAMAARES